VLWRTVRSPELGQNTEVTIVSIICGRAKEAGKPYSKRILPPFVIPYCQIGREGVMAYLGRFPDGRIVYRFGNELLGARDIRTIRRHIAMGLASGGAFFLMGFERDWVVLREGGIGNPLTELDEQVRGGFDSLLWQNSKENPIVAETAS